MFKKIIPLMLVILTALPLHAQGYSLAQAKGLTPEEKTELTGTRKQLATIVFAGLSGAILGLSTLSFYGRPQDHLSNIAVGFAFGVIGGAIYTTYQAAAHPYDAYDMARVFDSELDKRILAREDSEYSPRASWQWTF